MAKKLMVGVDAPNCPSNDCSKALDLYATGFAGSPPTRVAAFAAGTPMAAAAASALTATRAIRLRRSCQPLKR